MAPSSGYRRPIVLLRTGTLTSRMQHTLHIFIRGYGGYLGTPEPEQYHSATINRNSPDDRRCTRFQETSCPIHDALHCSFYTWHQSKSLFQPFVISCTKDIGRCHLLRPGMSPSWRALWTSKAFQDLSIFQMLLMGIEVLCLLQVASSGRSNFLTAKEANQLDMNLKTVLHNIPVQSATVVLAVLYITNLAIRNHTYVPSSHAASDWLTQFWPVWTRGYRLQKTFIGID
ncbi:hypothetical protein NCU08564 [Neurospora crassa OR74A]|uniref:Uncharacterized protein n=2 Tax=Neurospora crassa TaxID=5141 RepID=Q7SB30_NEUCR|nr:hypothetical protein NCU08564 [Neurospora crassa OR74A]EAA33590.2 hypothetical protein NCU08564 [Neurospora crassa OR74A]|eukprot:XP_962826.2 hypothetical protein NCU08564 [Neurospora crassa OR74A]